ncbi:hypothetical protein SJI00_08225 [Pseudomonas sp. RP23018S]|uniref:hypothetical protein n=1 Tax=Pseudomonas sp. RP23018S TaxID=3096037 RepID=UPI002ACA6B96|nr:hypothetical protein [Pseudomonas sp. RP23018S]MDZ5602757.1 hypothetical protein [Pseudomonas sp. RP23018S]
MSTPPAGTTVKRLFPSNDHLAPLPIPTGQKPCDVLNTVWRKNEVFIDIGNYSIGSAVMVLWPTTMLLFGLAYAFNDIEWWIFAASITGIPILIIIQSLFQKAPPPVRFNRQRREVCVPRENGEYWIVPWESVTAATTQHSSVNQAGKMTTGLLFIGFENPDPQAKEDDKHFSLGFYCGGGTTAMALWECMRSFMEIGPEALPITNDYESSRETLYGNNVFLDAICDPIIGIFRYTRDLEIGKLIGLIMGIVFLGGPLAAMLQIWKLSPPPDLLYPEIIEWSKPIPPDQWAKRSPELEEAIAKREAELAAQAAD